MSIHFPDYLATHTAPAGYSHIRLPAGAGAKGANTGFVFGAFVRAPVNGFERDTHQVIAARQGGWTGGNDMMLFYPGQTASTLKWQYRSGGTKQLDLETPVPAHGGAYLVLLIATAGQCHLVTCAPGGAASVASAPVSHLHNADMTALPFIEFLGCGYNGTYPVNIDMEEAFFLHGLWPETGGAPDAALAEAIADGSQDIATLAARLADSTGGPVSARFRYRMRDETDLSDAFGNFGALTLFNKDGGADKTFFARGYLRPGALRPDRAGHVVSQVAFATPGDAATAKCAIPVEGGAYTDIAPAAIEARLVTEDQGVLRGWTVIDAAPSGGRWTGGQIEGVPMTAGVLRLDFRAVDGAGAQIGTAQPSDGLRGAGFAIGGSSAQSQFTYLWDDGGGLALPAGARVVTQRILSDGRPRERLLSSADAPGRGLGRGMRQAAREIDALFPGVPVMFATIAVAGQSPAAFAAGGTHAAHWGLLAQRFGPPQADFFQLQIGHSSNAGHDTQAAYRAVFDSTLAEAEAALGAPVRVLLCPTPRYMGVGAAEHAQLQVARTAMRAWLADNPAKGFWCGSFSAIQTSETGADPHPSDDDAGAGRAGGQIGRAMLAAAGAILDVPQEIRSATAEGVTVRLALGPVNG
ncbi:hypothetical protein [Limimaricola sp.]|uniref:hypothetical protein n=1 Tax=Limimaricola sp. TaxID=2211665 RepID=UPI004058D7AF